MVHEWTKGNEIGTVDCHWFASTDTRKNRLSNWNSVTLYYGP